jgi:hypothetical protein
MSSIEWACYESVAACTGGRFLFEKMAISTTELPTGMYFLPFPAIGLGVSKIIKLECKFMG